MQAQSCLAHADTQRPTYTRALNAVPSCGWVPSPACRATDGPQHQQQTVRTCQCIHHVKSWSAVQHTRMRKESSSADVGHAHNSVSARNRWQVVEQEWKRLGKIPCPGPAARLCAHRCTCKIHNCRLSLRKDASSLALNGASWLAAEKAVHTVTHTRSDPSVTRTCWLCMSNALPRVCRGRQNPSSGVRMHGWQLPRRSIVSRAGVLHTHTEPVA